LYPKDEGRKLGYHSPDAVPHPTVCNSLPATQQAPQISHSC